jgi:hypothetical protein
MESLPCLVCGKQIKTEWKDDKIVIGEPIPNLHDGTSQELMCGYGSGLDGDVYMIAVCDACLRKARDEQRVVFRHNFLMGR